MQLHRRIVVSKLDRTRGKGKGDFHNFVTTKLGRILENCQMKPLAIGSLYIL